MVTRVQNSNGDAEGPARVHLCDGTSPSLTQEREQAPPSHGQSQERMETQAETIRSKLWWLRQSHGERKGMCPPVKIHKQLARMQVSRQQVRGRWPQGSLGPGEAN